MWDTFIVPVVWPLLGKIRPKWLSPICIRCGCSVSHFYITNSLTHRLLLPSQNRNTLRPEVVGLSSAKNLRALSLIDGLVCRVKSCRFKYWPKLTRFYIPVQRVYLHYIWNPLRLIWNVSTVQLSGLEDEIWSLFTSAQNWRVLFMLRCGESISITFGTSYDLSGRCQPCSWVI